MKALVVDDSNINLKVTTKLLEREGIIVENATSGKESLEKLKDNTYDVIFMDIMMPEMDGVKTYQELQKMPIKTPVVALTADALAGAKEKYLSLGFFDYLEKPIKIDELKIILTKVTM